MTWADGESGEPLATAIDNGLANGKTLKKKKSLLRLFPPASRKSSRSRPPSPEYSHTPPTPQVPTHYWTLGPSGAPRIPSMSFDALVSERFKEEQLEDISQPEKRNHGSPLAMSNNEETNNTVLDATGKSESDPASRQSLVAPKGHPITPAPNIVHKSPIEKPIIHYSPTFPALPNRTKTGLHMQAMFLSTPRDHGASATTPKPKSSPAQPQAIRPSTAGGDSISKPIGKRRVWLNKQGQDLSSSSLLDLDDFPIGPWQATYSSDEVRSSFRSALTTNSSHIDTTSTERSSVFTKGTSITDSTIDQESRPVSKADSMTVDDAIDMYAAGFADDDDTGPSESRETSMSEEERRRSTKIAEAIQDTIGDMRRTRRPTTSQSTSSTARISYDAIRKDSNQPPPILSPSSTRDQYGFLKISHHITISQYDVWSNGYLASQERRAKRWSSYMQEQGLPIFVPTRFPSRSAKTERYIRKGIPPAWRGSAWFFYAGGEAYLEKHAGLYTSLVSRSEGELSSNDKESIERDLHRTFPDNVHFKPDLRSSGSSAPELPLLSSLRHVLRAYALHNPRIGYCQSLNFLAGLLLLFLSEEKAFWMLHIITTAYLPGTHELSLEGTNVDLWILMVALKSSFPHIWAKVGSAGGSGDDIDGSTRLPPISLCTTSWFMSLFIGTLPIETVLRVWDCLFYEGSRTLFRVALTIFKLGEQRIKEVTDPMELFQVVQSLPRGMLDAGAFMATVCRRGGVGGEWVEARRRERREWFAKQRATAAGLSNGTGADDVVLMDDAEDERANSARGRPPMIRMDSIWRRRKRKMSMPSGSDGISDVGRDLLAL